MKVDMDSWHPIARVYHPLTAGSIDGTDTRPHDRAVERAIKASYIPPSVENDSHLTLFVARLNPETTEKTLQKTFSKYGDIKRVSVVRDAVTGFSKQYAFIEFEEERSARHARSDADQSVIEEHIVFVDWECERTLDGWIPRRLGGGFGGKKESGQLRFGGRDRPFKRPISVQAREDRDRDRDRGIGRDRDREREDREIGRYRGREDRDRGVDRDRDDRDRDNSERNRERDREMGRDRLERDKEEGEISDRDKEYGRNRDRRRDRGRDRDRGDDEGKERIGDRYRGDGTDKERHRERDRDRDRRKGRDRERDGERKERRDECRDRENRGGRDRDEIDG